VVDSPKIFMQVDVLESQRPYKYTAYSERRGKRKHSFPMDFPSNQPAKKVGFHVFFNVERCFWVFDLSPTWGGYRLWKMLLTETDVHHHVFLSNRGYPNIALFFNRENDDVPSIFVFPT